MHRHVLFGFSLLLTYLVLAPASGAAESPKHTAEIGAPSRISQGKEGDFWPQFSPDGKRIVYYGKREGKRHIFVMDREGKQTKQLTDGAFDNRDPSWSPDGSHIYWSSNKDGRYNIWVMKADGTGKRNLTRSKHDEFWPRISPIPFRLFPVEDARRAPGHGSSFRYHRILFQRGENKGASIWSMWDDGRFPIQISPGGITARHPSWSPDGLEIAFDVEQAGKTMLYRAKAEVFTGDHPPASEDVYKLDLESLLKRLPKEYVKYPAQPMEGTDGLAHPVYFPNLTGLLSTRKVGPDKYDIYWVDLRGNGVHPLVTTDVIDFAPGWSPTGREIAFTSFAGGASHIYRAPSKFYLSHVLNLYRYPEIVKNKPEKLATNQFVIRPDNEKEFFHLLEKARYAKKGVFVSTDPFIQLYHDAFEGALTHIERRNLAPALATISNALYRDALSQYGLARDPAWKAVYRELVSYYAVPVVLLGDAGAAPAAAKEAEPLPRQKSLLDRLTGYFSREAPKTPESAPAVRSGARFRRLDLPGELEAEVAKILSLIENHQGLYREVDFTQFKVRGHYDDKGILAAYFRAMIWYGLVPIATEKEPAAYVAAYRQLRRLKLWDSWKRIYSVTSLFAGSAEDLTYLDFESLEKGRPQDLAAFEKDPTTARKLIELALAATKPNRIAHAGIVAAVVDAPEIGFTKKLLFLPQRYSLDAEILQTLSTPRIGGREFPTALDVLAALGSRRARDHIKTKEGASAYAKNYENALDTLVRHVEKLDKDYWRRNLYAAWLHTIHVLKNPVSVPKDLPPGSAPEFLRTAAWLDKQLLTAAASYTQLKHDTILYAKQPYAAEGGEGGYFAFFLEQPIEKKPKGYVEPHAAFFEWMAELAILTRDRLVAHGALTVGETDDPAAASAAELIPRAFTKLNEMMKTLAAIAQRELRGESLTDDQYEWIDRIGAEIEGYYKVDLLGSGSFMERSSDRLQNGVALVADVFSNLNTGQVLEEAIGDVFSLYVITPHAGEWHLNHGGVFSYYEFTQPMDRRLSDKEWSDMLVNKKQPPLPEWVQPMIVTVP